uniref:Core shell protein Gag P30 domain-containing protein n=1 Tax=Macaca fascicularis TaxID=9541 RepID=A0A7N9DHS7_MACFA
MENPQLCKACNLHPTGGPLSLPPNPSFPIAPLPISDKPPLISPPPEGNKQRNLQRTTKTPRLLVMSPSSCKGREIWPTQVHVPFSLSDLKQIKADLGRKFSDDPDRYIDVLQGLGEKFDLTWRDVMLLDQTLVFNEKNAALAAAQEFGDTWYLSQVNDRMTAKERDISPTSQQAIPSMDLHWGLDSDPGDWSRKHLLTCVLEGLQGIRKKPMNCSMMSTITQEKEKNPSAFLEQLREASRKYIPLSPNSLEGQLILKGKLITHSAADIRRKLQTQALGPEQNLEPLLNLATLVFYNRDQEEQAEKQKLDQRKAAGLVMSLRQTNLGGSERTEHGAGQSLDRACYQCALSFWVRWGFGELLCLAKGL